MCNLFRHPYCCALSWTHTGLPIHSWNSVLDISPPLEVLPSSVGLASFQVASAAMKKTATIWTLKFDQPLVVNIHPFLHHAMYYLWQCEWPETQDRLPDVKLKVWVWQPFSRPIQVEEVPLTCSHSGLLNVVNKIVPLTVWHIIAEYLHYDPDCHTKFRFLTLHDWYFYNWTLWFVCIVCSVMPCMKLDRHHMCQSYLSVVPILSCYLVPCSVVLRNPNVT